MRLVRFSFFFVVALMSALFAPVAMADDCSKVAYGKIADGYLLQDLALMASDEPVFQGGMTLICGKWSFDYWHSEGIGNDDPFAREIDFTVAYSDSWGGIEFMGQVQYYLLNDVGEGLGSVEDDVISITADFTRTFTFGDVSVTPVVRINPVIPMGYMPSNFFVRPGVTVKWSVDEKWSLATNVAYAHDFANDSGFAQAKLTASYQMTDALSLTLETKLAGDNDPVTSFGFAYGF